MTSTSGEFGKPKAEKRKRRGLMDFMLVLALGYGVYAKTPIGAVVETGIRVARGQHDHPSWFATFKGRELDVKAPVVENPSLPQGATLPASVVAAAEKHKVDKDALAAFVAARGTCDAAGACTVTAPDRLPSFVPGKTGVVDVDVIAAGLAAAAKELSTRNTELAIEAMFTGAPALTLALESAHKSNLAAADDVEVHGSFFTPATRRGPLQGALQVLLMHRLRTLAWPATGFRITSPFGERIHPVTGIKSFHNGTDIGVPSGTPLHSAHNGSIKRASKDSISGNYIIVDHGLGVQTTYCHMTSFDVAEKDRIGRDGVIGLSGATGRITGPHVHYILRINDKAVDAEQYGASPTRTTSLAPPVPEKKPTPPPPPPKKDPKALPPKKDPKTPEPPPAPETPTPPAPEPTPPAPEPTPPAPTPESPTPTPETPMPTPETPPAP